METVQTDVLIAGGGPAGMVLGLLLAKRGIDVLVLEQQATFDREYRGEVLQPRFVQMMQQLNLLTHLEQYPHMRLEAAESYHKDRRLGHVEFRDVSPEIPYAIWMPQPILLQALHDKAQTLPSFRLWFHASAKRLVQENDSTVGLVVEKDGAEIEVRAKVTVGADGRFSTVRRLAQMELEYEHYENDLIWFTSRRPHGEHPTLQIKLSDRHAYIVLPKYPDAVQGGMFLKKGEWKNLQSSGLEPIRAELLAASEAFAEFAGRVQSFREFFLLQARIMYAREWAQNGLLLIGDAAHCASPAGAVGVSLSVATAILAADVISRALADGDVSAARLREVQEMRSPEIRRVHALQMRAEKG